MFLESLILLVSQMLIRITGITFYIFQVTLGSVCSVIV